MLTFRRSLRSLACLSALALVAACQSSGYYDSQGYYHSYDNGPHAENVPGGSGTTTIIERDRPNYQANTTAIYGNATYGAAFSREGFYDRNGYYISLENGPVVPSNMIPAHGVCRVWFTDRDAMSQPPVESCNGIQSRVPAGAYVLYGG